MGDTTSETLEQAAPETDSTTTAATPASEATEPGVSFSERYSDIIGKLNQTLDQVDWNQMGRISKATGIIVAVIVAQILIKVVLDTINLLPIIPGLLELLGLVVVGQWSWNNLTTSEKRSGVVTRIQNLRKEYLG